MAEKKHVIEYTDIIKAFEKVKEKLKNKSDKGHQHGNADITDIDASKIKSGTIDIDRLPKGAIERMVYVKDDAARFALTTNTTQNGDTVKVRSTKKMFYVIDDTKLSSEAGYEAYTAESASAVPWSGVTGKPTTFTPEAHTHAISDVADLQETLTGLRQDVNAKPSKDTNTTYSLIQDSTDGHKLTFKGSDGSTKTVTIPDNDHNDNTWRDVVDSLDSARTDASLSANQGRVLNGKFGGYLPLHGTADIAASVTDYGDTAKHIQIGFSGAGITGDDIKYIAGYTGGDGGNLSAKIKDISKDALKSWLGLGSRAYDSTSYLPLSGGEMSGDIIFNGYGTSTIGTGSKDGAGLDAKNNLNIASWYGVSFTSKCAGLAYSDKPGVSIDCRNGTLAVAGAIYANGGVVGDLTGNAKTATTANSANSAKYINYSINKYVTGNSMKTPCWRFATIEVSSDWYDQTAVLLVNTGCAGGGFGIIKLSVRSNQISNTENAYCEFSWLVRRGFDPNQFIVKGYSASKTTNYFDIYFKATGTYQGLTVTALSSGSRGNISFDWKLTNDDPRAAMDLRKYNYELISSDEGVAYYANTANHLYNTQGDGSKNSMNFYWMGKDGQPTWLWGGTDGSNMYVYNPSNFSVNYANSAGSADKLAGFYSKDSSQTWGNQIGTFISGMGDSTGGSLAFRRDNPTAGQLSAIIDGYWYQNEGRFMCLDTNNYSSYALPLSGGTITGRIVKNTNGSWVGDRDRAVVYSMYPGDDSYGCVACMPTKNGSWSMGNLGGVEHLIFNYVPDANYSANKNESIHVYLRPTEGTIALTSDIPTSLPASDVYAWAKASSKPSYTASEVGAAAANHSHSQYTTCQTGNITGMHTYTNYTTNNSYNAKCIKIGSFCVAIVAITGTVPPRTWIPVAEIPTGFRPNKESNIITCSVSGSDHMEAMITKNSKGNDCIKVWWSGSSPASSANICIPYYLD